MNRCHRIGQTRQVEVTMYYTRDSVEERILAHRIQSGEPVLQSSGHNEEEEAGELAQLQEAEGKWQSDRKQLAQEHESASQ